MSFITTICIMMIKKLFPIISVGLLLSTTAAQAEQNTTERLLGISQYVLDSFSLKKQDAQENFIRFGAHMTGVSLAEARASFLKEKPEIPPSTRDVVREGFLSAFEKKDYPILEPAIEQYMNVQSELISSCKAEKTYTQPTTDSFLVPVTCSLPKMDWDHLQQPTVNDKISDAQNFVIQLNWLAKKLKDTPPQPLKTHILIENQDGLFVANPDHPDYFPDRVTRELAGSPPDEEIKESIEN